MRGFEKLALRVGVLTLLAPCLAQTHPALPNASHKLEITVTDENGVAVRSALVLLIAAPQANALHCETDFAGHCTFTGLAAATFQLRVEKQGFYAAVLPSVQPEVTAAVDVTLSHLEEVRSVVNVNESPPAIDAAQVSSKEQISGLEVIDIPYPATHDYRNVVNFIPGVVQDTSGQPHVAGAQTYQTLTLLDGFNVTQPANGLLLVRVSTDAFRSIEAEPSREPAEYGKGSGGVLDLNTGIGDDHFRILATNFIPSMQDKNGIALDQWEPRVTLSGPIHTRKMWFFDALEGEYDNTIITQLLPGADADHLWRAGNLAKVQANLTSRNILTTSFLFNYLNDQHSGLSPLQPVSTTPTDAESAYVGTVKDQHYFSGGELLEVGFNVSQYNLALTPLGTLPYYITYDSAGGNYYLDSHTNARRWQGLSNLYLPPHYAHGRHDIKLGVDLDRIDYDARFTRQPIFFWPQTGPPPNNECPNANGVPIPPYNCALYSVFSGGNYSTTYNFETSAYVEDRWLVTNRFLLEPGLRLDWDEIVRRPLLSPRLAGTYVLDDSGNTKLSAGVGLVYDATDLILIARPDAGERQDYFFNSAGQPTDLNGTPILTPTPVLSTFSVNRQSLESPLFLNWSVALEKKLPASLFLKAEFMQRRGTHDFAYDTPDNLPGGNFILQNTRDDRYNAFQLNLRRSFRQRYMVMGSYIRSSTHSNQALDFNVDAPILARVLLPGPLLTLVGPQAPGPLLWDAPNRFLSWGFLPFFRLPIIHELDLAYSAEARTGFPFNVFTDQQLLYATPCSYRFPTYFTLNLHLEKRFHLFGYYWALRGGFDDITGRSNPVVVNADVDAGSQFLTFSGYNRRAFTSRIRFLGRK